MHANHRSTQPARHMHVQPAFIGIGAKTARSRNRLALNRGNYESLHSNGPGR